MTTETGKTAVLFVTCLGDTFYPAAAAAVWRVLQLLGIAVTCPAKQTCCGQPMFNAGYFREARRLAQHFLDVFAATSGPIVAPSASCAAMVREHYPKLFANDPQRLALARSIGARTFEFCEFLTREQSVDLAQYGARFDDSVTFHWSCHFRSLGVKTEPVDLIRQIAGIRYLALPDMNECCGFGGAFALHYPDVSRAMVADKLHAIRSTGAHWLIYADAGCALNITGYANRVGQPLRAMHIAELIDRSLGEGS